MRGLRALTAALCPTPLIQLSVAVLLMAKVGCQTTHTAAARADTDGCIAGWLAFRVTDRAIQQSVLRRTLELEDSPLAGECGAILAQKLPDAPPVLAWRSTACSPAAEAPCRGLCTGVLAAGGQLPRSSKCLRHSAPCPCAQCTHVCMSWGCASVRARPCTFRPASAFSRAGAPRGCRRSPHGKLCMQGWCSTSQAQGLGQSHR